MIRRKGWRDRQPDAEAQRFAKAVDGTLDGAGRDGGDYAEVWETLHAAGNDPDVLRMRAAALRKASGIDRRRLLIGLGGAGAAAGAGGLGLLAATAAGAVVSTGPGERLVSTLPDGSRVTLAPMSRLRVAYGPTRRTVRLERGQVGFDAVSLSSRPFVVEAGGQIATCPGGRFQVTLWDGQAQVLAEDAPVLVRKVTGGAVRQLSAGQVLAQAPTGTRIASADVATLTAWRDGRLVFDDAPLGQIAAEFNRYSRDRLEVADDAARIRVSGAFRYEGARDFLHAAEAAFPVKAVQLDPKTWRIERLSERQARPLDEG